MATDLAGKKYYWNVSSRNTRWSRPAGADDVLEVPEQSHAASVGTPSGAATVGSPARHALGSTSPTTATVGAASSAEAEPTRSEDNLATANAATTLTTAAEADEMDPDQDDPFGLCSPVKKRLRSARTPHDLVAKECDEYGRGLFLKGSVRKGDEIVFFEGNSVERCSWRKKYWEQRGVCVEMQKRIADQTQVQMPISSSMPIVHAPLLELALAVHVERPNLRLSDLMGTVGIKAITDVGGEWFFMNDAPNAAAVNVKVQVEQAKGHATKRLVWRATRDITPAETGEELLYAYDRDRLLPAETTDASESEEGDEEEDEEASYGAEAAAMNEAADGADALGEVSDGAEAEAMDEAADGDQDAAAAESAAEEEGGSAADVLTGGNVVSTPDATSDEVTMPLGWPYETLESPFQTTPNTMLILLIGRVISHLVGTIGESGDLRVEAFKRKSVTRASAASKSVKPCRAWTTLRNPQRALVTRSATRALPGPISDGYIALAFGPALLARVLMQMRGCSLRAAQQIVDPDCPEYHDPDGPDELVEDHEEGAGAGDTAGGAGGAAAAAPRGSFDLGQALQRSLPMLYEIQAGRAPHWSSRHATFLQGGKTRRSLHGGYSFGGLDVDDLEVIGDFMRDRFDPYVSTTSVPEAASAYIMDVLVPDCIVYLVMQKYRCSHYDAICLSERRISDQIITPTFTADETHDSLVEAAIAAGRYTPVTYRPTPPLPVSLAKEEGAQMPDASACFAKSPAASMATGSAFASLAAAVTHMSTAETEHASAEAWRADVEIGTAAFLASTYVGKPTIGHSPHVSPMESVVSMASKPLTGLATEYALRADAIRRRCKQLKTCPKVQIDLSDFGTARLGGGFVKDLIAGALTCRKGATETIPPYAPCSLDEYDHEVDAKTEAAQKALLKLQKTALLITHGTSTYAVLVHEDGTVAFRDPHSLDQLNFSSPCSFLAWVEQQLAFAGPAALPFSSTYFRWNPLWPATAIFGIVVIPPATATEDPFDVGSVQSMYDTSWLPSQLSEPPAGASPVGDAKEWLHRCLFWDQGPLTGGWTEGAVTRTHDEMVSITLKPKVLTAAAEAEELCIDYRAFAEAFSGRARWATAASPRALFLEENADFSPCQFCGNAMQWFAKKEATTANCHGVCCNYREVDYSAIIHGSQGYCESVYGTCKKRPGQVFGCQRCPNDVGPVGPSDGPRPASGSGLYRCHLLCARCQTHAEKGLHGLDSQVLRPEGEHFWQIGRPDGKLLPAGKRAVNAFVVAQWLSPSSAKRLVDEASRMGRLSQELTERELTLDEKADNYLSLGRRSRGGPIFNYLPGDLVFGCEGVAASSVAEAVQFAKVPFPPNSYNLRQQFELSKDGNNGFTCSAADFPILAIARKYEECCFLRAMAVPDRPFGRKLKRVSYILVGSKILMSGRETPLLCDAGDAGDVDNIDPNKPSRVEIVQCNSSGEYAVEVRGARVKVHKDVRFDARSGQFTRRVRRYMTSQQLHHHDASQIQAAHTRKTGNPFWSCVGSLADGTMLNVNGFNVRLSAGLCGVQTGTNPHCGSGGYQEPRTHTYIDVDFKKAKATSHLHTVFDSFTTLLGLNFDHKGTLHFNLAPFDTDPNMPEEDDANDEDEGSGC
jgi:hypothetical protein